MALGDGESSRLYQELIKKRELLSSLNVGTDSRRGPDLFSFWAVVERSSGALIGDAGLYRTPGGEVELGYTLGAAWWGRGYATEAAGTWLQVAFERLGVDEVVALAEPANVASLHVLTKLGMQRTGERLAFGRPHAVFRGQRPASIASMPSSTR